MFLKCYPPLLDPLDDEPLDELLDELLDDEPLLLFTEDPLRDEEDRLYDLVLLLDEFVLL